VGRTSAELAGTGTSGDHGRGRRAVAPWQILWKGWKDILVRTYEQLDEDRVLAVAAGVVFYGLLALFPAITALVSCYALFAKGSTQRPLIAGRQRSAWRRFRHRKGPGRPGTAKGRRQARTGLRLQFSARGVERQWRHEGNHRRT
jgi:hypothetical protein